MSEHTGVGEPAPSPAKVPSPIRRRRRQRSSTRNAVEWLVVIIGAVHISQALAPLARGECPNYRRTAEAVYRLGRLTASYIHFYLPSDPLAAAGLLRP